ncbi:hypothetical protein B0H16DRAFT_1796981 [Mycena metata]|uniref:Uncharacterized protein n=1 Tax=Mycena metata TaxID=1033252 RepID=A0AAD7MJ58_9AGAR|nr:hypothetical protein B0H16DRAFT_1796981 [Mycena metata]
MKLTATTLLLILNFVVVRGHPAPAADMITRQLGNNAKAAVVATEDVSNALLPGKDMLSSALKGALVSLAAGTGDLVDSTSPGSAPTVDRSGSYEQEASGVAVPLAKEIAPVVPVVGDFLPLVAGIVADVVGSAADAVDPKGAARE